VAQRCPRRSPPDQLSIKTPGQRAQRRFRDLSSRSVLPTTRSTSRTRRATDGSGRSGWAISTLKLWNATETTYGTRQLTMRLRGSPLSFLETSGVLRRRGRVSALSPIHSLSESRPSSREDGTIPVDDLYAALGLERAAQRTKHHQQLMQQVMVSGGWSRTRKRLTRPGDSKNEDNRENCYVKSGSDDLWLWDTALNWWWRPDFDTAGNYKPTRR
jgi:hypothetical protein